MTFKNESGVWYTRALFIELATDPSTAKYTLKTEDYNGYPSLYRLFMEENDPEEYTFAIKHLGGWQHWKTLRDSQFFRNTYAEWKDELEVRYRSQAVANIMKAATGTTRDAIEASKYVAEKKWEKKATVARKPSNDKIKEEAQRIVTESKQSNYDLERLMN